MAPRRLWSGFPRGLLTIHLLWVVLHCALAGGGTPDQPTQHQGAVANTLPSFVGPVTNFTAAVGKTAHLTCRVQNLTKYMVAWFHMDRKMLLTIHKTVVTRIPSFSVVQDDPITWTLHIASVTREDKGQYMCQVNTEPMISHTGYLDVVVPPVIVDDLSSESRVVVQENGNVTLTCHAEGNPDPTISWMREDKRPITLNKRNKVVKHEDSTLKLHKVSRRDMGAYLCIAVNGVPPSVSKRIELKVQFSPIVLLPSQLMSAPLGSTVWLECKTEAYPRAVTFWKHNHTMVMSTNKYRLEETHLDEYTTTVNLTIKALEPGDFGRYLCYSRNSFGENDGTVELHEMKVEQPRINRIKNEDEYEEVNALDRYSKDDLQPSGRGQSQVILHNGRPGSVMTVNREMVAAGGGGVGTGGGVAGGGGGVGGGGGGGGEQKSQLGRGSPSGIFTSIMAGGAGTSESSLHPLVTFLLASLPSLLHSLSGR